MIPDQLRALSHRLEQAAKAGGLTLLGDDLRAAARVVAAMAKLEEIIRHWEGYSVDLFTTARNLIRIVTMKESVTTETLVECVEAIEGAAK